MGGYFQLYIETLERSDWLKESSVLVKRALSDLTNEYFNDDLGIIYVRG
jgi:hypothetical protein